MRRLVRLVLERAGFSNPSRGFLLIDDTILAHDSDTTTAIGHVAPEWNAETKRYVKGHVVFTAHWVTPWAFPAGIPPEDHEWRLEAPVGAVAGQEGATVWRALPDGGVRLVVSRGDTDRAAGGVGA